MQLLCHLMFQMYLFYKYAINYIYYQLALRHPGTYEACACSRNLNLERLVCLFTLQTLPDKKHRFEIFTGDVIFGKRVI